MSGYAYQWAKRQQVGDAAAKTVLKTYAHWASEDYTTWVTNEEMIVDTELNIQTIRKARKKLMALGFLVETEKRLGETRSIVVYQMLAPPGSTVVQSVDRVGTTISLSPPSLADYQAKTLQKASPSKNGAPPKRGEKASPSKIEAAPNSTSSPSKSHVKPLQIPPQAPPNLDPKRDLGLQIKAGESNVPAAAQLSPSDEGNKAEPQPGGKGERIHPDWKPNPEQVEFGKATAGWDDARVVREGQKFRNHWLAVPGDRGFKADWNAMWENWVLRDDPARNPAAAGGASGAAVPVDENWWESNAGAEDKGKEAGVPRQKNEPTPQYVVRIARALGKGPHIELILREAARVSADYHRQVVDFFGDALIPVDYFA